MLRQKVGYIKLNQTLSQLWQLYECCQLCWFPYKRTVLWQEPGELRLCVSKSCVCMCVSKCLCVLCHLWVALVDFIWSHKICIACVFIAQQTHSTDTDTAGDTDTATNTVAKCDRVLSCWARQLPNWFSKPRKAREGKAREEAPCRFGGCHQIIFKWQSRWAEGGAAGMACGSAKNKAKWRRPRRESAGEKKAEGRREIGWWRWRWAAANEKVKGAGVVLLPRHAVRQAYISMTSVTDTLLCVCVCVGELDRVASIFNAVYF